MSKLQTITNFELQLLVLTESQLKRRLEGSAALTDDQRQMIVEELRRRKQRVF